MGVEIGQVLAIGGPTSIITAIVVVLVNAYIAARKDRREQQAADVAQDSGIVDNAKKVLDLVRGETDRMGLRLVELENKNRSLENDNLELRSQMAAQKREIGFLQEDLKNATAQIVQLRAELDGRGSTA